MERPRRHRRRYPPLLHPLQVIILHIYTPKRPAPAGLFFAHTQVTRVCTNPNLASQVAFYYWRGGSLQTSLRRFAASLRSDCHPFVAGGGTFPRGDTLPDPTPGRRKHTSTMQNEFKTSSRKSASQVGLSCYLGANTPIVAGKTSYRTLFLLLHPNCFLIPQHLPHKIPIPALSSVAGRWEKTLPATESASPAPFCVAGPPNSICIR